MTEERNVTSFCSTPIEWSKLVAYFAGELEPTEESQVEEHYFECSNCSRVAAVASRLVEALREAMPPVLNEDLFLAFRDSGALTRIVEVDPEGTVLLPFETPADVLVCELRGDFTGRSLVDLELSSDRQTGRIVGAPVSADGSTIRLVCMTAFAERFGREVHLVVRPEGKHNESLAGYQLDHEVR